MKINPLNFFGRRTKVLPPHFITTSIFASEYQTTLIDKWIYENCHGRYCMIKTSEWIKDRMRPKVTIGFENPSDLTLLALSGQLNK